jgi:hypothetical protein
MIRTLSMIFAPLPVGGSGSGLRLARRRGAKYVSESDPQAANHGILGPSESPPAPGPQWPAAGLGPNQLDHLEPGLANLKFGIIAATVTEAPGPPRRASAWAGPVAARPSPPGYAAAAAAGGPGSLTRTHDDSLPGHCQVEPARGPARAPVPARPRRRRRRRTGARPPGLP